MVRRARPRRTLFGERSSVTGLVSFFLILHDEEALAGCFNLLRTLDGQPFLDKKQRSQTWEFGNARPSKRESRKEPSKWPWLRTKICRTSRPLGLKYSTVLYCTVVPSQPSHPSSQQVGALPMRPAFLPQYHVGEPFQHCRFSFGSSA